MVTSQRTPFYFDPRVRGPQILDDLVVEGVAVGQVQKFEVGGLLEEMVNGSAGHQPGAQDVQLPENNYLYLFNNFLKIN